MAQHLYMKSRSYLLYAEDDPDDRTFLRDMLYFSDQEHQLLTVENGFEVIRFLQDVQKDERYPSLIILDIRMPRLNGIEVLKLIKTDDMFRMIPVIVFSNHITEADKIACHKLDTEIIAKPLYYANWDRLIQKLCTYFDD